MIDIGTSTQIRQYNPSSDLDLSRDPLISETFRRVAPGTIVGMGFATPLP